MDTKPIAQVLIVRVADVEDNEIYAKIEQAES